MALEYARPGVALGLLGRNGARLNATAKQVEERGGLARVGVVDVRDRSAMREFLLDFEAQAPIDALIASAGVSQVTPGLGEVEDLEQSAALFEVNLMGAMNMLAPVVPLMRARRSGHIALFSSLAAFAPPPDSPSYAGSKAALLAFGLATRALYRADGVRVSVVCPGFVDTPMTGAYRSVKPMMLSPEAAARRIRRGLERNKAVIAFPTPLYWLARLQGMMPDSMRSAAMLRFRAYAARPGAASNVSEAAEGPGRSEAEA